MAFAHVGVFGLQPVLLLIQNQAPARREGGQEGGRGFDGSAAVAPEPGI